jgi:mannose/fructose/N-acetylgalactosamine-specific phosphotransferase system component IIB
MSVALYRIDDRLIHGQVVVGWGQPLGLGFVALVDEAVRASEWEQELYRMGVPPSVEVWFAGVEEAVAAVGDWEADPRVGIMLTGDIATMAAVCAGAPAIRSVNVGGIHFRPGRTERLRFVYLSDEEAASLRALGATGVAITAQDVPTAAPVPLEGFA